MGRRARGSVAAAWPGGSRAVGRPGVWQPRPAAPSSTRRAEGHGEAGRGGRRRRRARGGRARDPQRPSPGRPGGRGARGAHNGPSARAPPGSGCARGAGRPGAESFSRGRELKRPQNKAAAHMGQAAAGGGAPTRDLRRRAGGSRGPQTLCARGWAEGAGAPGGAAWAPPPRRVGFVTPRGQPPHPPRDSQLPRPRSRPAPASVTAWSRLGSPAGPGARRRRVGAARREPRPRRHVPAGRAARGEGGGHGGDCAPPPIVPGLGLGPRATGTAVAEPPPLWAGLWGGRSGGHKGGAVRPRPRRVRASAPPVAARLPPGNGLGGGGCRVRQDSSLTRRPLAAVRGTAAARPLVRHVLPA